MSAYERVIFQNVPRFRKLFSFICNRPNNGIRWRKKEPILSYSPIRHTLFFFFFYQKKRFLRGSVYDISPVRLVLFIHIVPSKQPKMRLWISRESDDLEGLQILQNIFQPHWNMKMIHF
jgi:hypothetical protein